MRSRIPAFSVSLALTAAALLGAPARAGAAPAEGVVAIPEPDPVGIANGQVAMMCAWPAAVAVTSNGALCTGSLVHPRVVMFAAHCGGGNKKALFGQQVALPFKTIGTSKCMTNPSYGGVNDQEHDWAFCVLDQEITEIPITPVVYGCETEIVTPGRMAAITGFGITFEGGDAGIKNWGLTPIQDVHSMSADVGGGGDPGICPGDSGGPALVQYPDGSWHVFGIASTLTGQCGGLGTHSLAWNAVPWIEEESGIDITPCHDVDGTWNPTHHCTGFYAAEPGVGYGEFGTWCEGTPANPSSKTCGSGFDAQPDNTPPTVSITTPVSASYPDMTTFKTVIEIDAQDGDGWGVAEVRLKINGAEQPGGDKSEPFGFEAVQFPEGIFEIVAVAEDAAGLVGESPPVVLMIGDVEPPDPTTGGSSETGTAETGDADSSTPTSGGSDPGDGSATNATLTAPLTTTDPMADEDGGCGCRSQPPASAALWLLAWVGIRRRRDPRAPRAMRA
jgi:hypothetical protein